LPKDVRHRFDNKKQIWKSAKTSNLKEALLIRDQVLADYKLQFIAIRSGGTNKVYAKDAPSNTKIEEWQKKDKKKVLIFIVAYNAEKTLEDVLNRIPASLQKDFNTEILVIDDASKDNTFHIGLSHKRKSISKFPFNVLKNPINQGYGGNQKIGYHYAIKNNFDFVALLHGDGQYAPEYLPKLLTPLNKGKADAVFGSRMIKNTNALKGGMPLYKFIGNKILTFVQNILLGVKLSEFHSGYRVYSVNTLKRIPFFMNTNDFHFDTEIIIQFTLYKGLIREVPIPTYYGDEICHVNGLKYAYNVLKTSFTARLQRYNLLYDRRFDAIEEKNNSDYYSAKLNWESSHSIAINYTKNSKVILDLGCANAEVTRYLAKSKRKTVYAVDKYKPKNIPKNVVFLKHDLNIALENSSFYGKKFDTILLLDVVEHLLNPEKFVDDIYKMVKSDLDTKILVTTGNVAFIITRFLHLFGLFNYGKRGILDITHTRLFTFKTLVKLFEQSGFRIEEVKGIPAPWPLILGENFLGHTAITINKILNKLFPGIFAYQIWLTVKPSPSLDYLLKSAERNK